MTMRPREERSFPPPGADPETTSGFEGSHDGAPAACARLVSVFERAIALCEPPGEEVEEPLHRFAASLLRMRVGPAIEADWLDVDPAHVSLFGGTNSGKSTILNVLLGRAAAGMNVTARFSQHPAAYRIESLGDAWLARFPTRFAGYDRYVDTHPPRQSDDELESGEYRPALGLIDPNHVVARAPSSPATTTAVLWDVPDFSTEQATFWLSAVLDTVALADVVVLAVTDESYADARVAALFRMVRRSGVIVHVVANKIPRGSRVVTDLREKLEVDDEPLHVLPFVEGADPEARLDELLVTEEAEVFRQAVAKESSHALERKRAGLAGAIDFLEARLDDLLAPLSVEVEAAHRWGDTVTSVTAAEFLDRYRSDYLQGERYGEFNQALVQVMDLLEVPGIGELVRSLRDVVRLPLRALTGLVRRVVRSPKSSAAVSPEHEVVAKRFDAWLAALRAEAQVRADRDDHPGWRDTARRLASDELAEELAASLEEAYGDYRPRIEARIRESAEEIHEAIRERPVLLNAMRGTNLAVDTAAVVLVVKSGGLNWSDAILGPAVAGLRRLLLESGMERFLLARERKLKEVQFEAMEEIVRERLAARVQALFEPKFGPEEIDQAREDFALVRDAALRAAGGGRS